MRKHSMVLMQHINERIDIMKKFNWMILAGMAVTLTACKSTSPEAQAVLDAISASQENAEHTVQEYTDVQAAFDALTEEQQKEVKTYAEYQTAMDSYFNEKKDELKAAFDGKVYYTSDEDASLEIIHFNGDTITISLYSYDGNGKLETASVDYDYTCDGNKIYLNSSAPMELSYSIDGTEGVLDGEYLTEADVLDGLQGNWTVRTTLFGNASEWNMSISGNEATYENAAEAMGYNDGSYYYYGPYSGKFTLDEGSVSIDARHGHEFFFSCSGGKVQLYHFGNKMTAGSGLKGEDGYENAF